MKFSGLVMMSAMVMASSAFAGDFPVSSYDRQAGDAIVDYRAVGFSQSHPRGLAEHEIDEKFKPCLDQQSAQLKDFLSKADNMKLLKTAGIRHIQVDWQIAHDEAGNGFAEIARKESGVIPTTESNGNQKLDTLYLGNLASRADNQVGCGVAVETQMKQILVAELHEQRAIATVAVRKGRK
jgi:hypothetical protein